EEGGEIRYAIDFSEIFSYIVPHQDNSRFFNIFSFEMTDEENVLFERLALRVFFYEIPKREDEITIPLILLPPYEVELDRFIDVLLNNELKDVLDSAVKAFKQVGKILQTEDFKIIEELTNKS